jgi:hypothetical protein
VRQATYRLIATPSFTMFLFRAVYKSGSGRFLHFVLLLVAGTAATVNAQSPVSNLHVRILNARLPLQPLDSLTVVPPLIRISDADNDQPIPSDFFTLHFNRLQIDTARLRNAFPRCSKIQVTYRTLPYNLSAPVARLDTAAIRRKTNGNAIEFDYTPYEPPTKPWESSGLNTNGAYTRGLSFGNSQNLVFNSNLNLQLSGKIGNDLEIQGVLSDNSIPLQPDGTTRQLQQFDRVFIQLKRKNAVLTAGDFDLVRPANGYFSNYFKRLQGAMVEYRETGNPFRMDAQPAPGKSTDTLSVRAAAAISKGKFARQTIAGQEGNQGPYRLQGAEGEQFIIVLAGTEKVYFDGQLLRRGLTDDYTIDYNLGELTFTAKRLITKDSRILVEFEYSVQNYLRSTIAANLAWNTPGAKIYFNLYSEQDGRTSSGAQSLTDNQRRRLAEVGDNLRNAYASGIDTLTAFDPARVLYRIADSVICGVHVPVLIYSTNPDSAHYAARFTEVPAGQGHYILAPSAANGRVYRWVGADPLTCQPRGNFEPFIKLVAPELRQLYTIGAEIKPVKNATLRAEAALSNRDFNRFSPLGDGNNLGGAGFLAYQQRLLTGKQGWEATVQANYEYTARTFAPVNPYRPAEFTRDWNTDNSRDTTAESLAKGGFTLRKSNWGSAGYEFGTYSRAGVYDGRRHTGQIRLQRGGFDFIAEVNLLETTGKLERSRFSRPKFDLSRTFSKSGKAGQKTPFFKIGLAGEREKNERYALGADTLVRTSFWYDLLRLYAQTSDIQRPWQMGASLSERTDYAPTGQLLKRSTIAREANLNGKWQPPATGKSTNQQLNWTITYRTLRVTAPNLTTQKAQETYLGRIDYNISAWKNALYFTTGYELGSGQSPKVEFNYLRVNPGQGQYTWIDRNNDGIIQLDEMEIAAFQDQASYVRVAVTTTDFIRTNNLLLNHNLRLEPRMLWQGTTPRTWQQLVGKLSTQSTLQINRHTYAGARNVAAWNPFQLNIPDSSLVTINTSIRNTLFVNRANPAWDASLTQGDLQSQVVLTTGFEHRHNADYTLHGRLNLSQQWSTEADITQGLKNNENQSFATRNYQIHSWEAGPKLTWMPVRTFRTIFNFQWRDSRNTVGEQEKSRQTNWNTEITWTPQTAPTTQGFHAATSLRIKGTFADIHFTGAANTAVAFVMLDGLQDGRNYIWSINLDRQLSKSMQISLNYEGRKTGSHSIVHVGRAQVRAIF